MKTELNSSQISIVAALALCACTQNGAVNTTAIADALTNPSAPAGGPSLADTTTWIEDTFNDNSAQGGSSGFGHDEGLGGDQYSITQNFSLHFDGCRLTVTNDEQGKTWKSRDVFNMELKDIDPNSITGVECNKYSGYCEARPFTFKTRNSLPLIQDTSVASAGLPPSKAYQINLYVENGIGDPQYPIKFERAFRHAVELCGGKPSPF